MSEVMMTRSKIFIPFISAFTIGFHPKKATQDEPKTQRTSSRSRRTLFLGTNFDSQRRALTPFP